MAMNREAELLEQLHDGLAMARAAAKSIALVRSSEQFMMLSSILENIQIKAKNLANAARARGRADA
jgi:hypothetical protein